MLRDKAHKIANEYAEYMIDVNSVKKIIDKIYDDFEKELKQAWIDGSDANHKALKGSGKLKGD